MTVLHIVRHKICDRWLDRVWESCTVLGGEVEVHVLGTDNVVTVRWNEHDVLSSCGEDEGIIINNSLILDDLSTIHEFEVGHEVI